MGCVPDFLPRPFPRMTHQEAMDTMGSDRPDTRFGLRFVEATDIFQNTAYGIFKQILAVNPSAVEDFRNGQAKAIGFLIGQAMQASQGKANPKRIREILMAKLN